MLFKRISLFYAYFTQFSITSIVNLRIPSKNSLERFWDVFTAE